MTSETEELFWIGSQEYKIIPDEIIKFAVEKNYALAELFDLNKDDFTNVSEDNVKKFLKNRELIPTAALLRIFDHMQKERTDILTFRDSFFPSGIKNLKKSDTVMLYRQGRKMRYDNCIAIVGTRNASTHAVEFARETSRQLAKSGYVIVSGLARGIDAAAHRGAISVGGITVAVLPWIFEPYPPEHERLLFEIRQHGSVLSENFFKSSKFDKSKFLQRNAIISAISDVLIAVESSFSGGTRWQVELALDQGKKVIAVEPERDNDLAYDGFMKFVKKGAIAVGDPSNVVELIKKEIKKKDHILEEFETDDYAELKILRKT